MLWYLSGYSLSSAVRLAVEIDKPHLDSVMEETAIISTEDIDLSGGLECASGVAGGGSSKESDLGVIFNENIILVDEIDCEELQIDGAAGSVVPDLSQADVAKLKSTSVEADLITHAVCAVDSTETDDNQGPNCADDPFGAILVVDDPQTHCIPSDDNQCASANGNGDAAVCNMSAENAGNNTGTQGLEALFITTEKHQLLQERHAALHPSKGHEKLITQEYNEMDTTLQDLENNSLSDNEVSKTSQHTNSETTEDSFEVNQTIQEESCAPDAARWHGVTPELANPTANLLLHNGYRGTNIGSHSVDTSVGVVQNANLFADAKLSGCNLCQVLTVSDSIMDMDNPVDRECIDKKDLAQYGTNSISVDTTHKDITTEVSSKATVDKEEEVYPGAMPKSDLDEMEFSTVMQGLESNRNKNIQIYKPNIKLMAMNGIRFHSKDLGSACLKAFFHANSSLEQLELNWNEFRDDILSLLGTQTPNIKKVSLVIKIY